MATTYRPRVVDAQLARHLGGAGAVLIEGPKACGKTTTASQVAASAARFDRDPALRAAAEAAPASLLDGATPRLIDEWQLVPDVWNAIRAAVDDRGAPGQFILTGSATPTDDITRHSGAMRFIRLTMRPMSLWESGLSKGTASVDALWHGAPVPNQTDAPGLSAIAEAVCRGGWPSTLDIDLPFVLDLNDSHLRTIASADIVTVDGVRRDPRKVEALLRALGRNTATYVSNRTLQADSAAFGEQIDPGTIANYLDALTRVWVLAEQYAWGGHLRSSAPARKAAKRHLVDPSLAAAAMGIAPNDLLTDHETFGQLFESLVFRDVSVYAQASGLEVRAFHDAHDNEIDIVLVNGVEWAAIEVKLSSQPAVIDRAANALHAIAARMTTTPRFLAIITATGPSYTRPDGVGVLAITHLAP